MRDPARIPEMVEVLRELWQKHPDLRLGQLLVAAASQIKGRDPIPPTPLFYIEDDPMLDGLLRSAEGPPSLPPAGAGGSRTT